MKFFRQEEAGLRGCRGWDYDAEAKKNFCSRFLCVLVSTDVFLPLVSLSCFFLLVLHSGFTFLLVPPTKSLTFLLVSELRLWWVM